jgi:Mg2+-importing ATPase
VTSPLNSDPSIWATQPLDVLVGELTTTSQGLSEDEAQSRFESVGPNEPARRRKRGLLFGLLLRFLDPLVIVLLVIGGFSLFFGERVSAGLVAGMALISVGLSFAQEFRADRAAEKLTALVRVSATALRNGVPREVDLRNIVPGDVVILAAGDMVPADIRVLEAKDLFVNQSALTGESIPLEKQSALPTSGIRGLSELTNVAFMGTSVVSGRGVGLVVKTGPATQFGAISQRLARRRAETSFEKGLQKFVWLMLRLMVVLVAVIFAANLLTKTGWMESLLFALAVAVGLTPEMLPMIVTLNLSRGALRMSKQEVIVKRLSSIQNLGAMNVFCTDKTGTLTMDEVVLERHCDVVLQEDEAVLALAYLNSVHQTGLKNLLDRAILKHHEDVKVVGEKVDEIPFDFSRRILSVVVAQEGRHRLIAKGAPEEIFKRCVRYELDGETFPMENLILRDLQEEYDALSRDGYRVLAVAYRDMDAPKAAYSKADEVDLVLRGYLAFLDPPKPSARAALAALRRRGVSCKVLTGDNPLVTQKIAREVGLPVDGMLTGDELEALSDEALEPRLASCTIFARLAPLQKERVIRLLQKGGSTVGYLGDGINDAPALKAADVGLSVDNAVDVARESADIILLRKNLNVLEAGIVEGRRTFANILKYIRMGASSNFGNMISMTGASLVLPFLPMLPIQILLNNFLYDISQVALPTDTVDPEALENPRPWDVAAIRRFMFIFGPLSSLFDFVTFGFLWLLFGNQPSLFHTGWFLESFLSQSLVVYVIRTRKWPWGGARPSVPLLVSSIVLCSFVLWIPHSVLSGPFKFTALSPLFYFGLIFILGLYLVLAQTLKIHFIRRYGYD